MPAQTAAKAAVKKVATKPVLSADEKKAARLAKKAREEAEAAAAQAERQAAQAKFMAELPLVTLKLMARFQRRFSDGCSVEGKATPDDLLRVEFCFPDPTDHRGRTDDVCIYLDSFSWNVENDLHDITRRLDDLDAADAEEARLRAIAQETYDNLTEEQRKALGLNRRP
jgi:hypothetical protein